MDPNDWFSSDAAVERLFASLQGRARDAAAAAVNGAADAASERLPGLANDARIELDRTIALARVRASQAVDAEKAHAIRILAEVMPPLRAQLNAIAREAGVSASGGAIDELGRRSSSYRVSGAAAVAGVLVVIVAAVAIGAAVGASGRSPKERGR